MNKMNILWITFDLGLSSDYQNMYRWLDKHNAEKCTDCTCVIRDYEYDGSGEDSFIQYLKQDISSTVSLREKDVIYVIYKFGDTIRGRFLFGTRGIPQWRGSWVTTEDVEDVASE